MTHTADIGPATPAPAPSWCEPGAEPRWDALTDGHGDIMICTWTRNIGADVWIMAEDRVDGGRVIRSAPRIHVDGQDGFDSAAARRLARELLQAAGLIEEK